MMIRLVAKSFNSTYTLRMTQWGQSFIVKFIKLPRYTDNIALNLRIDIMNDGIAIYLHIYTETVDNNLHLSWKWI